MAPSHTPSSARPVEPDTAKAGRIIRGMLFLLDALLLAIATFMAMVVSAVVSAGVLLAAAHVGMTIAAATLAVQTFRNKNPLTSMQVVLIGSIVTAALWLSVFGPAPFLSDRPVALWFWTCLVTGIGAAWWGLLARQRAEAPGACGEAEASETR